MKKIVLIIGGLAVAAAIVTFGAVSWNDKIATTSESAKEKIETVKKTDPYLTGDAPVSSDSGENPADGQTSAHDVVSSDGRTGQGVSGNAGSAAINSSGESPASTGVAPADPGTTLEEIKSAYRATFSELEVLENSKIDQMVVQAKADYVGGKYSKEDLMVKYQEAALALEAQADADFHAIYQQLEYDLKKNGHDVKGAVVYRNEYEQKKDERLSHVISKLSEF